MVDAILSISGSTLLADPRILSFYSPFSQVSEFEIGGVQESPVHVYLDGPATTKPLGHVSSTDSPISYDILNGESVRTSCTTGLRHCVPVGRQMCHVYLVEQNTH